jgi:hypothetical protein
VPSDSKITLKIWGKKTKQKKKCEITADERRTNEECRFSYPVKRKLKEHSPTLIINGFAEAYAPSTIEFLLGASVINSHLVSALNARFKTPRNRSILHKCMMIWSKHFLPASVIVEWNLKSREVNGKTSATYFTC